MMRFKASIAIVILLRGANLMTIGQIKSRNANTHLVITTDYLGKTGTLDSKLSLIIFLKQEFQGLNTK